MRIRAATVADLPAVHALNQQAVPAMGSVDVSFFQRMAAHARAFLVAEAELGPEDPPGSDVPRILGFLLALPPGMPYDSPNYQWFEERLSDFVYVDRVAVATGERGRGTGRALYEALDAALGTHAPGSPGLPTLCCEVNLRPPNPGSLAFHQHLGFHVVGEQDTEQGTKRVALMVRSTAFDHRRYP